MSSVSGPAHDLVTLCYKMEDYFACLPPVPTPSQRREYYLWEEINRISEQVLKNRAFQLPVVCGFKKQFADSSISYIIEQVKKHNYPSKNKAIDILQKVQTTARSFIFKELSEIEFCKKMSDLVKRAGVYFDVFYMEKQPLTQRSKAEAEDVIKEIWKLTSISHISQSDAVWFKKRITCISKKLASFLEEDSFWGAMQLLSKIEAIASLHLPLYGQLEIALDQEITSCDLVRIPPFSQSLPVTCKLELQSDKENKSKSPSSTFIDSDDDDSIATIDPNDKTIAAILLELKGVLPKAIAQGKPIVINIKTSEKKEQSRKDAMQLQVPVKTNRKRHLVTSKSKKKKKGKLGGKENTSRSQKRRTHSRLN